MSQNSKFEEMKLVIKHTQNISSYHNVLEHFWSLSSLSSIALIPFLKKKTYFINTSNQNDMWKVKQIFAVS